MKRVIATTAVLLAFVFQIVSAAEIPVAPGLNTLANAVNAANAGDVLILERDAGYPNQGVMVVNVPITIKAADGTGALPAIVVVPDAAGAWAGSTFQLFADITFENLAFSGIRVAGDRAARIGQMFQMAADNLRAVIDGCTFIGYGGRTLEPGRDGATLIVRNCIETGNGRSNRVDNGRFIDFRAASVDTLILQNNTLLNCADRWIRHMLEDASLDYALVDHNTFMNGTGYRPSFQFRNVKELYFINNIIANPSILGTTKAGVRKDEIEYDEPAEVTCTFTMAGADTSNEVLVMRNNNAWRDARIDNVLGGLDLANGDSVEIAPWFNQEFLDRIDLATALFAEPLDFVHPPTIDSLIAELEYYVSGAGGYSHSAFIFRTDEYALGLDMSYGTTAQSYTAAGGGFPLGDLNWYPDKKAEWEAAGKPTVVEGSANVLPKEYKLEQNHPNPFNPTTTIGYELAKTTETELSIYNLIGQKVRTLVSGVRTAGAHTVTWDGKNDAGVSMGSGVYFYKLVAGSESITRKMLLAK